MSDGILDNTGNNSITRAVCLNFSVGYILRSLALSNKSMRQGCQILLPSQTAAKYSPKTVRIMQNCRHSETPPLCLTITEICYASYRKRRHEWINDLRSSFSIAARVALLTRQLIQGTLFFIRTNKSRPRLDVLNISPNRAYMFLILFLDCS